MGETQQRPFQLSFNSSLRVEFQGARVTSDGGLILVRDSKPGCNGICRYPELKQNSFRISKIESRFK